jgi:pyroglutamyl-peptidase
MSPRPAILLTGFGPFPGVPVNATSAFVPQLAAAARQRVPEASVVAEILPTEWHAAPRRLEALLALHDPTLAVHFGVSTEAQGLVIETTARNLTCAKADACGALPFSPQLIALAPDTFETPLSANVMVARLTERGLPSSLSTDAGRYLCNAVLYRSLHHAATRAPGLRAVFVHLPASLLQPGAGIPAPDCPLDWTQGLAGGLEILAVALDRLVPSAA